MTYVTGFLTPVKSEDKARYVKSAQASWPLFQKYGALSQVDTWGEDGAVGKLTSFPRRGTMRDDLRPGLRTTAWRRRVTIAFAVEDTAVVIVGIFYGGRDFETLLNEDS